MKKVLFTVIAFLYLGLAVRATVHLHDCIDIFAGSADTHATPFEKFPCNGDPKQCKFETEQKINEAALKSYRVLDQVLLPALINYPPSNIYISHHYDWDQHTPVRQKGIPLFILHRVIRR